MVENSKQIIKEETYQKAHEIGIKLANYFEGFQVLVATHTDREHIHNHLIINSVNFENGNATGGILIGSVTRYIEGQAWYGYYHDYP